MDKLSQVVTDSLGSSALSSGGETGGATTAEGSPFNMMEDVMPMPLELRQNVDDLASRIYPVGGSSYVRRSSVDGQCVYLAHNANWNDGDDERRDLSVQPVETDRTTSKRAFSTNKIITLTKDGKLARRPSRCVIQ